MNLEEYFSMLNKLARREKNRAEGRDEDEDAKPTAHRPLGKR